MSKAPEWIYLDGDVEAGDGMFPRCFENPKYASEPQVEYVRVDLAEAAEQQGYASAMEDARKLHEARIEELEAKLAKAVEWHPIETAPTDEAVLICGGDVLYPCVASLNNGEWDAEAQGGILREDVAECPTHWMPLPAEPTGGKDE